MSACVTSQQTHERRELFDRNKAALEVIARFQLVDLVTWSPAVPLATYCHTPTVLDRAGYPVPLHHTMAWVCPRPLLIPTVSIKLIAQPASDAKLAQCVEQLSVELLGDDSTDRVVDPRFAIEFVHQKWSSWFPPALLKLNCGDGRVLQCPPGDEAKLESWAQSYKPPISSSSGAAPDVVSTGSTDEASPDM